MKKFAFLTVVVVVITIGYSFIAHQFQVTDVTGKWKISIELSVGQFDFDLDLKQTNDTLITGTYSGMFGNLPVTGTIKNDELHIVVPVDENKMLLNGTVIENNMKGKIKYTVTELGEGTFQGERKQ